MRWRDEHGVEVAALSSGALSNRQARGAGLCCSSLQKSWLAQYTAFLSGLVFINYSGWLSVRTQRQSSKYLRLLLCRSCFHSKVYQPEEGLLLRVAVLVGLNGF